MKKKFKASKRILSFIMVFITIITTILTSSVSVYASELDMSEHTGFNYLGISPITGIKINHNIYRMKMDNKVVFCVEPGIKTASGGGYISEEYINSKKDILSKIAYYGYTDTNKSKYDYALTQIIIWEELGDKFISTTLPNYHKRKAEILEKVNRHNILPSWNNEKVAVKSGETIELQDKNGIVREMKLESNNTGTNIVLEENTLKITANEKSTSGVISYRKIPENEVGTSIVYRKPNYQSLAEFHMESSMSVNLNINVIKLGNIKVKKVDEDTGKALANTKLKFEYDGKGKEIITDSNGIASIEDIPAGTNVTISEVTAPNGYFNKGEIKKVVIEANKTIEVTLGNKEQLGNVILSKRGKDFGTEMPNDSYKLEGAIYSIYNENDQKITTMTTDKFGKATSENIKLGKFYALEEKAPEGYLISKEKIPFELKYAGQTVEVTSTSISQKDTEQKGKAILIKEDEKTGSIPQGSAKLDGAVYELRKSNNDELVETVTIKGGKAKVEDLYLGKYYWIEKKAPEGYLLDTTKHYFEISYAGENVETSIKETLVKEKVITGGFDLIKFGEYDWKEKIKNIFKTKNKEIKPLKYVEFSVFSDTTEKLVKTGYTDEKGYLKFGGLPYDTYTVKETKTPEGYIAAKDFKVTVKKQNETHHYAIQNRVIEEKLKVVKIDSGTKKIIPVKGAEFKIKSLQTGDFITMPKNNEDKKTDMFYTNDEGYLITPEALSYGEYELTEVKAPDGYVLAKDPIHFKVDGSSNGIIEIRFENTSQKGIVEFTKKGQTPKDIKIEETKYGKLHEIIYEHKTLENVAYDIIAKEDITTNDGTIHFKKGDVIETLTTDEKGQWKSSELYLGKYQAIEKSAPNGYIISSDPIDFELSYSGQLVELTKTSIVANNDFQSLLVNIFKNEEKIEGWKDNKPIIKDVKGNGKIFGIFTREEQVISDNIKIPENSMVGIKDIKDGVAELNIKLPEGKYYLKEIDSGENHILNDKEYGFEFNSTNNDKEVKINIYADGVDFGDKNENIKPILNKLQLNSFKIKKINEKAIQNKRNGFSFEFTELGQGAKFILEDKKGNMIQEVTIGKDSIGEFNNIPVGTFYLKEKETSSNKYILSNKVIRIESTKEGVKAFDKDNNLISEKNNNEDKILLEIKNELIKGGAKLIKTDLVTGEALPNTGIRILDEDKNILIEGRTDDKGVFYFDKLSKGTYYFQEYEAPKGYQIDETPMKFEIKENGEVITCKMTNKKIQEVSIPKTGDYNSIILYGIVLLVSGTLLLKIRRKKDK
ncbi:SpaA isopeptide-forming pilin-related protein [Paraclostridium sordellii]|uniref:SpaA isopeptide-forming pilin-related protein n=1 Tax=Paraclostridium sordellii TaxID=1505 RepID=UPI0005E22A38|nr:SpaA isopeptide-forming pilin-related protein [Paeniclostridium sordellii]CEP83374.1 collagen adhesin [[Clostridium] sordellii] [Paeniclostridium sordellii]